MAAPLAVVKAGTVLYERREILLYGVASTLLAGFAGVSALSMLFGGVTNETQDQVGAAGAAACGPNGCTVSGTEQAAAQALVSHMAAGRLAFIQSDGWSYDYQVQQVANGDGSCGLALPVLQLIEIACGMFDSVAITDLNRACTGVLPGGASYSAHWVGRAIDFASFNGTPLTGADAYSVAYIRAIESLLPAGSQVGQVNERISVGNYWELPPGVTQITDGSDHLHVDVGRWTTAGLNL